MNRKLDANDVEYEIYVTRETEILLFSLVIRTRVSRETTSIFKVKPMNILYMFIRIKIQSQLPLGSSP